MALNKTLNATCDLGVYLFCRMPEETLKIGVKIKTKWGSTPCFRTLTPGQRSTTHMTGQIEEAVYVKGGGEHPEGK